MYNKQIELYEPYQGFIRGNMFPELFDQYGRIYDIKPMNEQAELLTYIDIFDFALIDEGALKSDSVYEIANSLKVRLHGILDSDYNVIVNYQYDAWGRILSITDNTIIASEKKFASNGVLDNKKRRNYRGKRNNKTNRENK